MKKFSLLIVCLLLILPLCLFVSCGDKGSQSVDNLDQSIDEQEYTDGLVFIGYKTLDGTCYVDRYEGMSKDVIIPSYYKGGKVVGINAKAFKDFTGLKSIIIPNSVTNIGESVFSGCSGLESITLPVIPENLECIFGTDNYDGGTSVVKSFVTYYIPSSLRSITVNSGDISSFVFSNFSMLTSIVLGDEITNIDDYAFWGCNGLKGVVLGNSVTCIGAYAFYGCSGLTSIAIPNSVTSIKTGAFVNCSGLKSILIPNGVTDMGSNVFFDCNGLTTIYCEAPSKPEGWDDDWNLDCSANVVWGYQG